MMVAKAYHIFISAEQWPLWVRVLISGLPTFIAPVVLIIVLLRERRKRPRA